MNIYEYLKTYNKTFKEEDINEIDKVILSLIPYIDFTEIVEEPITLKEAINKFLKIKTKKEFTKKAFFDNDIYKMIELLINNKRYQDIILKNYEYKYNEEEQFSAITMILPNHIKYIGYEGTDSLLIGWKEDFQLSYMETIPAQKDALEYAKNNIKITDTKVILGGHSKGGNLALYTAINLPIIQRLQLKEIVSIDGPGLLEEIVKSKEYERINHKYIHIIPNYSYVGILLTNTNDIVVKTNRKDAYSHSPFEWPIEKNKFIKTELSEFSKKLSNRVDKWLEKHNKEERQQVTEEIFSIFERLNVKDINQFKNPLTIIRIYKETKKLDETTKEIIKSIVGEK